LDDAVGHEVPHRVASVHPLTAVGGGDRQGGDLESADDVLGKALGGQDVSRPGHRHEVRQIPEFVVIAPSEDLGDGVGPRDEEELGVGTCALQVAQVSIV
jgi:hypothetical protein